MGGMKIWTLVQTYSEKHDLEDFFNAHQNKTKQNKTENSRLWQVTVMLKKERTSYSLIWLDFILTSGHGLMILYRFSQFNVLNFWEFEKKHKSAMRNCTLSTFILLGLTDDPPMQVLIFMFLFCFLYIEYTGIWPSLYSLVDSHLKTAM